MFVCFRMFSDPLGRLGLNLGLRGQTPTCAAGIVDVTYGVCLFPRHNLFFVIIADVFKRDVAVLPTLGTRNTPSLHGPGSE